MADKKLPSKLGATARRVIAADKQPELKQLRSASAAVRGITVRFSAEDLDFLHEYTRHRKTTIQHYIEYALNQQLTKEGQPLLKGRPT